jgi:hypothetical protein
LVQIGVALAPCCAQVTKLFDSRGRYLSNLAIRIRKYRLPGLEKLEFSIAHGEGCSLQSLFELHPSIIRAGVRVATAMAREKCREFDFASSGDIR